MFSILISLISAGSAVAALGFAILEAAASWFLFKKAGEPGWKSLIPIYNGYVAYKIAWRTEFFWVALLLSNLGDLLWDWGNGEGPLLALLFGGLLLVLYAVLDFFYCVKLARAFGKGLLFAIGLVVLKPVFIFLLAFSSAQYRGADL